MSLSACAELVQRGDPDRADRMRANAPRCLIEQVEPGIASAHRFIQRLRLRGRMHARAAPVEQAKADRALHVGDQPAHRRLADIQHRRGGRNAPAHHHGAKRLNLSHSHRS